MMNQRPVGWRIASLVCLAVTLQSCDRMPEFVFVREAPQAVTLTASASARQIRVGDAVVLHVERRTTGVWRRMASKDLQADQCWMAAVPPEHEPEVADNVHWIVDPPGAATFNTGFRSDHTRTVVLSGEGRFALSARTTLWCEPGRSVTAPPVVVDATAR